MGMKLIAACLFALIVGLSASFCPAGASNSYPSHPVRIIVSLPAGSAPDVRTRIIAKQLTAILGQQIIVENRPGAGGALGVQSVLSAQHDGYTLLSTVASVFTVLPAQREKLPFDVTRDLIPVAMIANEGMVFAVSSRLGVKTLGEFIALTKKQSDKLVIGTNPAGSLPHLAAQLFVKLAHAPIIVAPSTGGTNEAIREILGGRIHAVIEGLPGLKPYLDNGDLKALATMDRERVASVPDLPTATETVPGLTAVGWIGIFAPKGTSEAIVQQLATNIRDAMSTPAVKIRLEQTGSPFRPLFTTQFARFIELEQRLWWPVVMDAGLR
jgi:tripartite-type tricarboxylate transporter receptor subunit TctC